MPAIGYLLTNYRTEGHDAQPEHDGCGDADGGEEELAASVIAGRDAAPVLEAGKEVLDPVALPVELAVVAGRVSAPTPGRDARGNPLVFEGFTEPVGV